MIYQSSLVEGYFCTYLTLFWANEIQANKRTEMPEESCLCDFCIFFLFFPNFAYCVLAWNQEEGKAVFWVSCDVSSKTNEIRNKEMKEWRYWRRIVSCSYIFLFISILAHCVLLGWNQRAKKKEGRAVPQLAVTSLRTDEIRNEETKERRCRRRNVAPARRDRQRRAAKCGGGMRRHCTVADSRCIGRQLSK